MTSDMTCAGVSGRKDRTICFCRFIACEIDLHQSFAGGLSGDCEPKSVFKTECTQKENKDSVCFEL